MMRTDERPAVVANGDWPGFDERCEALRNAIEGLDLSPLHSIAGDTFRSRFATFQEAAERFFRDEAALLQHWAIPGEVRRAQLADQQRIGNMLDTVRADSLARKNQTAIEVYEAMRHLFGGHLSNGAIAMRRCLALRAQLPLERGSSAASGVSDLARPGRHGDAGGGRSLAHSPIRRAA